MDLPFHPLINRWFHETLGSPTDIQSMAWKDISAGDHCLLTAPTGSGKTLAAFLWSIHSLIQENLEREGVPILYISPLKALNNDIQRNLTKPLKELRELFKAEEVPFPAISTALRSGDTPQYERQKIYRNPPDIFITTPESLHIMLTSVKGRNFLQGIQTVILDEIHALLESRRGVLLTTALERLAESNGEFQRIGLSATVHPLERAAHFMGGYQKEGTHGAVQRQVKLIRAPGTKQYELTILSPPEDEEQERWGRIAQICLDIIDRNRSTLFFTDSRRVTEKAARLINDLAGETLAWAHHGSLSRELRFQVEQRMKEGKLKAIIATSSLELGIDIGSLDQVVLLQSPSNQNSMLQRIGRAGHSVGETSRAVMIPLYPGELLQSAALIRALHQGLQEEIRPVQNPLDVLAQLILSITHDSCWKEEELYRLFLRTWSYHNLPRKHFDLTLEMLEGRYSGSTLKELQPRIIRNPLDGTVKAREKGAWLIYTSGGVIPDRGYYDLRTHDGKVKIGELDEEFVWERNPGESFTLGNQVWKILRITDQYVEVQPATGVINIVPFWKAEDMNRSPLISFKIGEILDQAEAANLSDRLLDQWKEEFYFNDDSAAEMMAYLKRQKEKTGAPLPGYRHILFEYCRDNGGGEITEQLIVHTLRGGAVNQPLALALVQGWKRKTGVELPYFVNNDGFTLLTAGPIDPEELLAQVTPENLKELLIQGLMGTPFFGSRFRECAGRALLLPKANIKKRVPLWMTRLRSKKLLDSVSAYEDFPIILEAWRTSLEDHFDLPEVIRLLDQLRSGEVSWSLCRHNLPSPFAESLVWRQVNLHLYGDDTPNPTGSPTLSDKLLSDLIQSSQLRPRISEDLVQALEQRLQRLLPGYGADSPEELSLWLNQRRIMALTEWDAFLQRSTEDSGMSREDLLNPIEDQLHREDRWICLKKNMSQLYQLQGKEAAENREELLYEVLRFYGPRKPEEIAELYGLESSLNPLTAPLLEEGRLILDHLTENTEFPQICTAENLEFLLRMARRERQELNNPRDLKDLALFLACQQQLIHRGSNYQDMQPLLDSLIGLPLPVDSLESSLFPSRFQWYNPQWFDQLLRESGLSLRGEGEKKVSLLFPEEISLWCAPPDSEWQGPQLPDGSFDFFQLKELWQQNSRDTASYLWKGFWEGKWSNREFQVIRRGIENRFQLPDIAAEVPGMHRDRRQMGRWKASRPMEGYWYALPQAEAADEELEEMERDKERVRQLLSRYGILFRELLQKEKDLMSWRKLFPALRMMELSGELISGQFFTGLTGLQFSTIENIQQWRRLEDWQQNIWFINARDPASLCGTGVRPECQELPRKIASNWLCYRGSQLMLTLEKNGSRCQLFFDPSEEFSAAPLWESLLCREVEPLKKISINEINGLHPQDSLYLDFFQNEGFKLSGKGLILRRQY